MKKNVAPEVPTPDEYHGQGGEYVVEDGRRRLVTRTKSPEPAAPVDPLPETKE